ncbi:MAG: sulfite exporter TauE/SafE family protein [Deltaproteobacteria bacterium]|nr:sulfite exporter TauE/SafE family protein [Deltaproteobacteria bacterium]
MTAMLLAALGASLFGSLHCVGMCGPFVGFYAGSSPGSRGSAALFGHLGYHGGRLVTYLALGAAAGVFGRGLNLVGEGARVPHAAAILSGALMIVWGGVGLLRALGVRLGQGGAAARVAAPLRRVARGAAGRPPAVRGALLGLLTTLLPCGWLYAFVLASAGTGSAFRGLAVMGAFWLGTVPLLLGLGLGLARLARPLGRALPVLTALVVLGLGVAGLLRRGLMVSPVEAARTPAAVHAPNAAASSQTPEWAAPSVPACHHADR